MTVPFELYTAMRYLLVRRSSLASIGGVAVGVMALVIALALMTGMQQDIRDKLIGAQAHVYVHKLIAGGFDDYRQEAELLLTVPGVVGAAPSTTGRALVTAGGNEAFISIKGMDLVLERGVTDLAGSVVHGSIEALEHEHDRVLGGVIIGEALARNLGVFVGDTVTVLTQHSVTMSPIGLLPRPRRLQVVGIFNLGLYEYDNTFGFVTLEVAGRLFGKESVDLMQLRVADLDDAAAVAEAVPETLGANYYAQGWNELNEPLFSALWLEKMAISISVGLITLVAALNIVASLIRLVMEKSRDIAILKTMGATSRSIRGIFVLQGGIIGLVGTCVGAVSGFVISRVADRYQLIQIPGDVYPISWVPFRVVPFDFLLVVTIAVLVCLLATIYPSRQASRLDPAEALRYQ